MESNIKKGKNYRNGIIWFGFGILLMVLPLVSWVFISLHFRSRHPRQWMFS